MKKIVHYVDAVNFSMVTLFVKLQCDTENLDAEVKLQEMENLQWFIQIDSKKRAKYKYLQSIKKYFLTSFEKLSFELKAAHVIIHSTANLKINQWSDSDIIFTRVTFKNC